MRWFEENFSFFWSNLWKYSALVSYEEGREEMRIIGNCAVILKRNAPNSYGGTSRKAPGGRGFYLGLPQNYTKISNENPTLNYLFSQFLSI